MVAWHPVFVHFPLALLSVGVFLDLFGEWKAREDLRRVAWWNLFLGTCGAALAVLTGWWEHELLHEHTVFAEEIHRLLFYHQYLGFALFGLFLVLLAWRRLRPRLSPLFSMLSLLAIIALIVQAYLGGEMVYRYGAGVQAVSSVMLEIKGHGEHDHDQEHHRH